MTPERWAQVARVAEAAMALPVEARQGYLAHACADDTALQSSVSSLLARWPLDTSSLSDTAETAAWPALAPLDIPAELGNGRFRVHALLGSGGFGSVYQVHDRETDSRVAAKVLRECDPARLYLFKQEFRKAAKIRHPNIVRLFELFSDGQRWFFTMELVRGTSALDYVRRGISDAPDGRSAVPVQLTKAVLDQLIEGLMTLHATGIVHGDIKPQNVMVSEDDRVVLLDFGLARPIGAGATHSSSFGGTPAYMAPELVAGSLVTEAADWYGVGVLLHEMLTGATLFEGTIVEILLRKCREEVSAFDTASLPEPWGSLCHDLMKREPSERPLPAEIRTRIGSGAPETPPRLLSESRTRFVGRSSELNALHEGFRRLARGAAVVVHLHGPSGVGKTALMKQFIEQIRAAHASTLVLEGRCYEHESVPFKALDEVIDALSRWLRQLGSHQADAILPRDLSLLVRLFPVMAGVLPAYGGRHVREYEGLDDQEKRTRALAALKELLGRLTDRRPLVIWIDDLQWSDLDSVHALHELLSGRSAPNLLLILSYRSEDLGTSPILQAAVKPQSRGELQDIGLSRLSENEARQLAGLLLDAPDPAALDTIVREADGSPLFLRELTGAFRSSGSPERFGLAELILHRAGCLPASAQNLLKIVAVAGRPIRKDTAFRAAGLAMSDRDSVGVLVSEVLLRVCGSDAEIQLDTYHDHMREVVLTALPPSERRLQHGRLGHALEAEHDADPERLVQHWLEAQEDESAYRYAIAGAERANQCLAFDRAARLYRLAFELRTRLAFEGEAASSNVANLQYLKRKLGDALANAGRPVEAAEVYLEATAEEREGSATFAQLRRRGLNQLLRSTKVTEALALLRSSRSELGVWMPAGPLTTTAAVLLTRLCVNVRGVAHSRRGVGASPARVEQLDTMWTAGVLLSGLDPLMATYVRGRHLLLALRTGEPKHIAIALASESAQLGMRGMSCMAKAHSALAAAQEAARQVNDEFPMAVCDGVKAILAFCSGQLTRAVQLGQQSEAALREYGKRVRLELVLVRSVYLSALSMCGRWTELASSLAEFRKELEANPGAMPLTFPMWVQGHMILLAADNPEEAMRELDDMFSPFADNPAAFGRLHYWHSTIECLLYQGRCDEAWASFRRQWKALESSWVLRWDETNRIRMCHLGARCAIAVAELDGHARSVREYQGLRRVLTRSKSPVARGYGLLLDAAIASATNTDHAIALLSEAHARLQASGLEPHAAVALKRRGELIAGARGSALVESCDQQLASLGVRNVQRFSALLAPGFGRAETSRNRAARVSEPRTASLCPFHHSFALTRYHNGSVIRPHIWTPVSRHA